MNMSFVQTISIVNPIVNLTFICVVPFKSHLRTFRYAKETYVVPEATRVREANCITKM